MLSASRKSGCYECNRLLSERRLNDCQDSESGEKKRKHCQRRYWYFKRRCSSRSTIEDLHENGESSAVKIDNEEMDDVGARWLRARACVGNRGLGRTRKLF